MTTLKLNDYSQNRFNLKLSKNLAKLLLTVGIVVCTETYVNGSSWYRIYSDGWCEQGGVMTDTGSNKQVTFLKEYINTDYSVVTTIYSNKKYVIESANSTLHTAVARIGSYNRKATTHFYINCVGGDYQTAQTGLGAVCWVAKGYVA